MYRLYMITEDHFSHEHTGTIPELLKIVLQAGKLRIWQIWNAPGTRYVGGAYPAKQ